MSNPKSQAPNPNHSQLPNPKAKSQIPNPNPKSQIPTPNSQVRSPLEVGGLELGLGLGIWEWLGFGAWDLGFVREALPVFLCALTRKLPSRRRRRPWLPESTRLAGGPGRGCRSDG